MECMTRAHATRLRIKAFELGARVTVSPPKMPMAAGLLPLLLCLLLISSSCSLTAASTLWGLDQLGAYFSGIFRSVVGPLFGFGATANTTSSSF